MTVKTKTGGHKIFSFIRKFLTVLVITGLAVAVILGLLNFTVINSTSPDCYSIYTFRESSVSSEHFDCVIVLGCAAWGDDPSPMLADRLRTAAMVYETGCCDYVLVSGDGANPEDYDEIGPMKNYLISLGVPSSAIACDPLGLSTYETMLRAHKEFGINRAVIVTTGFHVARSVYDSRAFGIESVGVEAVNTGYVIQPYNYCREFIARGKDFVYAIIRPGA